MREYRALRERQASTAKTPARAGAPRGAAKKRR